MGEATHDLVIAGSGVAGLSAAVYAARADLDPLVLSTCATCDGAFHRDDDVLVVGGGDSAIEEALFLAKFADSVTVLHRRDELRASEIMTDRAREHDDIEFAWNTELVAIHGSTDEGVISATILSHPNGHPTEKYEDGADVTVEEIDAGGVFYAIGHEPNTAFLRKTSIELDDSGYVQTTHADDVWATTKTAVDGVFAAGDVMDREYQQAITAAGMGSMAALDAEDWLESSSTASTGGSKPISTEASD